MGKMSYHVEKPALFEELLLARDAGFCGGKQCGVRSLPQH